MIRPCRTILGLTGRGCRVAGAGAGVPDQSIRGSGIGSIFLANSRGAGIGAWRCGGGYRARLLLSLLGASDALVVVVEEEAVPGLRLRVVDVVGCVGAGSVLARAVLLAPRRSGFPVIFI